MYDRAVGHFDAFPAIVAVHRVVAADQRCNFTDTQFAHFLLKLLHELFATVRRGVAAIHETVHENSFNFVALGHFQQRKKVFDVRVDAAVAQQAEKMKLALAAALHRLLEKRDFVELPVGDQHVNFGDVHAHDAACADIHVADFTVAHLSFGQANSRAGCADESVGKFAEQLIVSWFASERDSVAFGFRAVAPAVEHGQYNWFRSFCHSQKEYTPAGRVVTRSHAQRLN